MGKVTVELVFYCKKYLRVIVKYNGRRTYKTKSFKDEKQCETAEPNWPSA